MTTITATNPGTTLKRMSLITWTPGGFTNPAGTLKRNYVNLVHAPQVGIRRDSIRSVSGMYVRKPDYKGPAG